MKNKLGFTLAEILLSLVIIGVIMALSVNSIKIVKTSYTSLAYFAHRIVLEMAGSLYSGTITNVVNTAEKTCNDDNCYMRGKNYKPKKCTLEKYKDTDECTSETKDVYYESTYGVEFLKFGNEYLKPMVTRCVTQYGKIVNVLKTDGEEDASTVSCDSRITSHANTNLFCKSLVALSNHSGSYNCSSLNEPSIDETTGEPTFTIDVDSPNFTLTNGMRFYVSAWTKDDEISEDYGYRLIAVDLNGKQGPNTLNGNALRPTDIVRFLVLDNGEVYPLGEAADNLKVNTNPKRTIQYLKAKVKGYYYDYKKIEDGDNAGKPSRDSSNNLIIVRDMDTIPKECNCKQDDGGKVTCEKCSFGVVSLVHQDENNNEDAIFTYREALCTTKKNTGIGYEKYCEGIDQHELCPPVGNISDTISPFDNCKAETIKPLFRFNF